MAYRNGQRLQLEGLAGEPLTLRLSVNPRARRVSLRIDARAGETVVVAPSERRLDEALRFARNRAHWISERLASRPEGLALEPGAVVPLFGGEARLASAGGAGAARLTDQDGTAVIVSGGEGEAFSRRVQNLLKRLARDRLQARTDVHLATLGQRPVRVSIIDARSRWGSCSPHNRSIRYSWRVVMAPPEVLDYLAAHEVAHLVHADHSPAFWGVVERLVGDHRPFRRWLRDHGAALQAVGAG